jgi:hypothetical protein
MSRFSGIIKNGYNLKSRKTGTSANNASVIRPWWFSSIMQRLTWTLCPLWSDLHLFDTWGKNRGPEFDTFSPETDIISPGTHFFEGSELTIFSLLWKKGQVFDTSVTNKYYSCWIGVVDLPRDRHEYQLPINHQHTRYMKLSVHRIQNVGLRSAPQMRSARRTRQEFKNENNQYPGIWQIYGV